MPTNVCTFTESSTQTCLTCTGQPFVARIPEHISPQGVTGWDTGANSVRVLSSDLEWSHNVPDTVAAGVAGLRAYESRESRSAANITHGWWFARVGGSLLAQVFESGRRMGEPVEIEGGDELKVRRVGGVVTYRINDVQFGDASATRSVGPMVAGSALFGSGDRIY